MDLMALKHLLREIGDFLEEEAENRAQAGSTMSDYARQPHKLMERIDMALAALPPKNAPLASVSPSRAPDGWVLVPREPTEAMLSHVAGTDFRALSPSKQAAERAAYANMLAAVPARNSDKGEA